MYVSVLGGEKRRLRTLAGLAAAHGVLQRRIARELRLKRTPTLAFEYDPTVERGVRMTQLIDELAPDDVPEPPQTTQPDLAAVADAIRSHDRFCVTSHENPDGDALGSLLATHEGLVQLGKDSVMVLVEPRAAPGRVRVPGSGRPAARVAGRLERAGPVRRRLRPGDADRPRAAGRAREARGRRRPPPRQHALRRREPDRRRTRRRPPRSCATSSPSSTSSSRRGSPSRSTSGSSPTRAASSTRTRRRRRCGSRPSSSRRGRTCRRVFRGRLRVGAVREAEAARAGARPRADSTRAADSSSPTSCATTSTRWAPRSRTQRGSSTTCARSRAPRWLP